MDFRTYDPEKGHFYDEMFADLGKVRPEFQALIDGINEMPEGTLAARQSAAEAALLTMGVTFTLREDDGAERIFPFDVIPRLISAAEWRRIETGLTQRIRALNEFISDCYGKQRAIEDGVLPRAMLESSTGYRPQCRGLEPPRGVWAHVSGTDLVRDNKGEFYVLEDNLRCPSGVSYVLENRQIIKRTFPRIFEAMSIRQVADYSIRLFDTLRYLMTDRVEEPRVVVLTPGPFNSAYYEHAYLAQQMGVELVEARDLVVSSGYVQMRTTHGLERVDVIYRRIDDDFLDPAVFRDDSMLGVRGLMGVYLNGKVALANAPGTGIADDKAIYAYVEKLIKYYLDEDPILKNVPTYVCSDDKDRKYVLEHLEELVVKATDGAGGYGMLIGPHSNAAQREDFAGRIQKNPRGYIAQPTLQLSRVPVIVGDHFEGRHVDLRPYSLFGHDIYVQPGGLTRVALKKGSLVVNSSQGGGSKDTWVLDDSGEQA